MKTNPHDSTFPHTKWNEDNQPFTNPKMTGLTKREYFAAMAMQGIISKPHELDTDDVVAIAVTYADALIKQLNQQQ